MSKLEVGLSPFPWSMATCFLSPWGLDNRLTRHQSPAELEWQISPSKLINKPPNNAWSAPQKAPTKHYKAGQAVLREISSSTLKTNVLIEKQLIQWIEGSGDSPVFSLWYPALIYQASQMTLGWVETSRSCEGTYIWSYVSWIKVWWIVELLDQNSSLSLAPPLLESEEWAREQLADDFPARRKSTNHFP